MSAQTAAGPASQSRSQPATGIGTDISHNARLEELMRQEFGNFTAPQQRKEEQVSRRKLLMIYIHGFLGSEESFRGFPAHVHSLLAVLLQETHVVHSKIYPRYRSRQNIKVACHDFSKWLAPHESTTTDTILLGHSMGGLVSADVALLPGKEGSNKALLHRILGTLSFDVPYLGMNPSVVRSGLASIFVPAKLPEDQYVSAASLTSVDAASANRVLDSDDADFWRMQDSNYNTAFNNDVILPTRGFWHNVGHFIHKHGNNIVEATSSMGKSYIEFMSAMSNGKELRERYARIRVLEEEDKRVRKSVVPGSKVPPRVRFANYYTVSTGRSSKTDPEVETAESNAKTAADEAAPSKEEQDLMDDLEHSDLLKAPRMATGSQTPSTEHNDTLPPFGKVQSTSPSRLRPSPSPSRKSRSKSPKIPKEHTFCNLPPKDSSGQRDPTWIRMFMEEVDEVGAHCGMFFVDERYQRFVGDVASQVEGWVRADMAWRDAHAGPEVD